MVKKMRNDKEIQIFVRTGWQIRQLRQEGKTIPEKLIKQRLLVDNWLAKEHSDWKLHNKNDLRLRNEK
ncbi:MAG: hypothetical protein ACRDFB_10310 [Rhabdochlamydiaceae bacterium]